MNIKINGDLKMCLLMHFTPGLEKILYFIRFMPNM